MNKKRFGRSKSKHLGWITIDVWLQKIWDEKVKIWAEQDLINIGYGTRSLGGKVKY